MKKKYQEQHLPLKTSTARKMCHISLASEVLCCSYFLTVMTRSSPVDEAAATTTRSPFVVANQNTIRINLSKVYQLSLFKLQSYRYL
jgi:hypothetical protein